MKRVFPVLLLTVLLTGCSGLPIPREMGDMALLRTLGVDASPAGVAVTGSTGPRAKGIQAEEEAALVLAADQDSLSGACLDIQGQSDSYVFFGYVDQLLLGEELAKQGVQGVLDYFARDEELGLGARLWLVRDASARDAVSSGGDEGAVSRLETLQTDGQMGAASISRTAGEVYADLLELGCAYIPALSPAEDQNAMLAERGYGILKGEALAGWLEDDAARGLELLAGGSVGHILTAQLPDNPVSVKAVSASTRSALEFQGDVLSGLKVVCSIKARMAEYRTPLSAGELDRLRTVLEDQERARLEAALDQLRALQADCTGLGAKAAMAHPAKWQAVQADWLEQFSRLPVTLDVQIQFEQ